jgi:hypothetical protein
MKNLQPFKNLALGFVMGALGLALAATLPNTFTSGTPISSSAVNANFAALKQQIDTLQSQVNSLSSANSTLDTKISSLETFNTYTLPRKKGFPRINAFVKSNGTLISSWSSTGATVSVTRFDTGIYKVKFSDNWGQIYGLPTFVTPYNSSVACDTLPFNDFIEVDCYGVGAINSTKLTDADFFLVAFNSEDNR